jgi:HK97 family phage major capsid protein
MATVTAVQELRHERAEAYDRMKEINDAAVTAKRDLSAEEAQEYDRLEERLDGLTKQITRTEKIEGMGSGFGPDAATRQRAQAADGEWTTLEDEERSIPDFIPEEWRKNVERAKAEGRKAPQTFAEFNEIRAMNRAQDDPEYRWAWFRYMTVRDLRELSPQEQRVLSKASAGAGLNLVPTNFQSELIDSLRDTGVMRQISRVVTTTSGAALQWPTVSSHGTASWVAESGSYSASDDAFGQTTLNAYKAGTLMLVSEELLADAAFNLDAYIRNEFGLRIGILENTAYVAGDGSGKPTGVTTSASAGTTAAGAAAITSDELIDMFHSLLPPYRRNASWLMKDSTIKLLRKLKDTTNQYLWQPGLQAGQADTLLGKPVYADPDMPAATTGLVSVLFGDFSNYVIRDVDGIAIQRLNELYAASGQVGFRAYHRTEGKLMNTAAVKKLTQA